MLPSILLLFLWCELVLSSDCPVDCTCQAHDLIFCFNHQSSTVPQVPASTRELYIFRNGIDTLKLDDFSGLGQLELLDLSQNELTEVPDRVFQVLSMLKNLDLSSNHITHISEDSFSGLVQLERLYLHSNRIHSIHSEAFESLENLLELKLQGNQLLSLPTLFFPRLLLLDLSNNNIPTLEPSDLWTPHLEALKVSNLGLSSLDKSLIASLANLHYLDFSMNQLAEVPQALKQENLKGLSRLNLSGNPLGELKAEDFQHLTGLQELDLSGLNLQGIPEGFLQHFPKLVHLTAAENPFNCLCPLAWFPVWLKEKALNLGRQEETRCHFPLVNAGKMLSKLDVKEFGCPHTTTLVLSGILESTSIPEITTISPGITHTNSIPSSNQDSYSASPGPSGSPTTSEKYEQYICPENICLNGGMCHFEYLGQFGCLCPSGTSGIYCENIEESPKPLTTEESGLVPVSVDAISSRHVTATSILLDLHRIIETQPHLRGIRLTYRNLSGPDHRPIILRVPASYPEYTLRGLRPNCTYSVCASPLLERLHMRPNSSVEMESCTEAHTAEIPLTSSESPVTTPGPLTDSLIPALATMALVLVLAVLAVAVACVQRGRKAKSEMELGRADLEPIDVDVAKCCLDNSGNGSLPHKQPESNPRPLLQAPLASQLNGASLDYEFPLIQEASSNSNWSSIKPSYV